MHILSVWSDTKIKTYRENKSKSKDGSWECLSVGKLASKSYGVQFFLLKDKSFYYIITPWMVWKWGHLTKINISYFRNSSDFLQLSFLQKSNWCGRVLADSQKCRAWARQDYRSQHTPKQWSALQARLGWRCCHCRCTWATGRCPAEGRGGRGRVRPELSPPIKRWEGHTLMLNALLRSASQVIENIRQLNFFGVVYFFLSDWFRLTQKTLFNTSACNVK